MNSRVEDGEPLLSYDGANAVDHSTVLSPLNLKNKMGKKLSLSTRTFMNALKLNSLPTTRQREKTALKGSTFKGSSWPPEANLYREWHTTQLPLTPASCPTIDIELKEGLNNFFITTTKRSKALCIQLSFFEFSQSPSRVSQLTYKYGSG